jgi:hypothetical protein
MAFTPRLSSWLVYATEEKRLCDPEEKFSRFLSTGLNLRDGVDGGKASLNGVGRPRHLTGVSDAHDDICSGIPGQYPSLKRWN